MAALPTGTVTFLFTDIEGSTTLLQRLGDRRYAEVLAEHRRLLGRAFVEGQGQVVDTQGDAFLVVFSRARDAVAAAVAAQQALMKHPWPDGAPLRVRMGLHTGEPISTMDRYVGLDVHRAARMGAAAHGGQVLLSDAVSALAARDLPHGVSLRDLGTHRLKDLGEPEHLFQLIHPDLRADFPPLKTMDAVPNNLPPQLTSFIGREREKAEIKRLLTTTRLLTLTGSGGAGKTRLAISVAAEVLDDFIDGVWLVELAPLPDPELVPNAVASVLGVSEQPGRPLTDSLADFLRRKALMLVLDNCEHLLGACTTLVDVLVRASLGLRVLATSREGLGIAGEMTYRVPSLSLPDLRHPVDPQHLLQYESVRLFAERAAVRKSGFAITPANAEAVAEVCHRLDGIPLAIELAASRLTILSVEQLLGRLNDRFRLLTGGSRTALPRQQTLRAVMDWSYGLLPDPERAVLRRLSVFAGGFTLEAAEAVCGGDGVEAADVLDLVSRLADKSLIVVDDQDGQTRYRLLETMRQYARDRLLESDDAAAARTRHRDFFLPLVEQTEPRLFGPDEVAMLERLETEHDNLRAALAWSTETGAADAGLRLAGALGWFWYRNGHWTEGRTWATRALDAGVGASPSVRANGLSALARLAWAQGDFNISRRLGEEELAIWQRLGDKNGSANALYRLGLTSYFSGNDNAHSKMYLEESLRLFREAGNTYGMASALRFLGSLAMRSGVRSTAAQFAEESAALYRAVGYRRGVAFALQVLGRVAWEDGDYPQAAAVFEEGLGICREVKDKEGIALMQANLGYVACVTGDQSSARTLFDASLRANKELGNRRWIILPLRGMAVVSVSAGNARRTARLFGALEVLLETDSIGKGPLLGMTLPPVLLETADAIAWARTSLGGVQFAAAWAEGRAMTLEQAIEYALADEAN